MEDDQELYREIILEHASHPKNFGEITHFTNKTTIKNPDCGDQYTIFMVLKDGAVSDIKFIGSGCSLSKASASIMASSVKGKTIKDALALKETLYDLLDSKSKDLPSLEVVGELVALTGARNYPPRTKCVKLAWEALASLLEGKA